MEDQLFDLTDCTMHSPSDCLAYARKCSAEASEAGSPEQEQIHKSIANHLYKYIMHMKETHDVDVNIPVR